MFDVILKFFILLSITNAIPIGAINTSDKIVYYVGVFILLLTSLFCKKVRELKSKRIIYLTIGLVFNSLLIFKFYIPYMMYSLRIMCALLSYVLIVQYTQKPKEIYKFFEIGIVLSIIYLCLQTIGFDYLWIPGSPVGSYGGLMETTPKFADLIIIVLPTLNIILMPFAILVCLVGDPETTILIVCFVFLLIIMPKHCKIYVIILFVMSVFLYRENILFSLETRYKLYLSGIKQSLPYWNTGVGIGNKFGVKELSQVSILSSSLLQFICCSGVIGVLWLGYICKTYVRYFNKSKECLAILGIIILSCIESPFEIIRLWIVMITQLAFFEISLERKIKNV